jgi:hypothetical protein
LLAPPLDLAHHGVDDVIGCRDEYTEEELFTPFRPTDDEDVDF